MKTHGQIISVLLAVFTAGGCTFLESPAAPDKDDCSSTEFQQITKMPTCIYCPEPVYPALAEQAGLEGDVTVIILVDKEGENRGAFISDSSGVNAGFEESALEAARASRFAPAEYANGCLVSMGVHKVYEFRIAP